MLTTTTQEFALEILKKLYVQDKRVPLHGIFELTYHCNLKCVHCYCVPRANKQELTYPEAKRIIDKIAQAGCIWLTFTGGEVFLKPDFLNIYTYAKHKGMIVTILTNGTLISPSIADHLVEYPPHLVEISLYGRTKQTYEAITRVNGSYERCLEAIRLLVEGKIPLKLKTMLLTLNKHELWEIKRFAQDLGLDDFRFGTFIHARTDGSQEPFAFRLPVEETTEMELQDAERMTGVRKYFQKQWGMTKADYPYQYACGAGRTAFAVNPYGELNICMSSSALNYDLLHKPFKHAFEDLFPKIINVPRGELYKECEGCQLFGFCGQCPPRSRTESGQENQPIEYKCQRARILAQNIKVDKLIRR